MEECEGKKQGWMIAGISTIGLTAVGVGVNIAQASKSNRLSDEIEMEKTTLQRQQDELNRIQNDIANERAKQAKKSDKDAPVYVPAGDEKGNNGGLETSVVDGVIGEKCNDNKGVWLTALEGNDKKCSNSTSGEIVDCKCVNSGVTPNEKPQPSDPGSGSGEKPAETPKPGQGSSQKPVSSATERIVGQDCTVEDLTALHAIRGHYITTGSKTKKCATSAGGALPAENNCSCAAQECDTASGYEMVKGQGWCKEKHSGNSSSSTSGGKDSSSSTSGGSSSSSTSSGKDLSSSTSGGSSSSSTSSGKDLSSSTSGGSSSSSTSSGKDLSSSATSVNNCVISIPDRTLPEGCVCDASKGLVERWVTTIGGNRSNQKKCSCDTGTSWNGREDRCVPYASSSSSSSEATNNKVAQQTEAKPNVMPKQTGKSSDKKESVAQSKTEQAKDEVVKVDNCVISIPDRTLPEGCVCDASKGLVERWVTTIGGNRSNQKKCSCDTGTSWNGREDRCVPYASSSSSSSEATNNKVAQQTEAKPNVMPKQTEKGSDAMCVIDMPNRTLPEGCVCDASKGLVENYATTIGGKRSKQKICSCGPGASWNGWEDRCV